MGDILTIHILNGDALRERFPTSLAGEICVTKECMVDGPVRGDSLEELFETRAAFLGEVYGVSHEQYMLGTASQLMQIHDVPDGSKVYAWFEDDLFCQVHLWFVCYLLTGKNVKVYLIRPTADLLCSPKELHYGFGGLSESELVQAYDRQMPLSGEDVEQLGTFWPMYQQEELLNMQQRAQALSSRFPFLVAAIEAHVARFPADGQLGRPEQSIRDIMAEQGHTDFATVFRAFVKRESVYGFGDLQVKRIYDRLVGEN